MKAILIKLLIQLFIKWLEKKVESKLVKDTAVDIGSILVERIDSGMSPDSHKNLEIFMDDAENQTHVSYPVKAARRVKR